VAADDKTEKATPKRRRDERKEGNVPKSKDVISVVYVICAFYFLKILLPYIYEELHDTLVQYLEMVALTPAYLTDTFTTYRTQFVASLAKAVLPFGLLCILIAVLGNGVQTKFLFIKKAARPKFGRLNPIKGIKNLFSFQNLFELLKGILKAGIMMIIIYSMLKEDLYALMQTMDMQIENSVLYLFEMIMDLVIRVCMIFAAIAFLDYKYQTWSYERKIRMSKQEIKEEYKQLEGDPKIKSRIKQMQRQRSYNRMMQAVPTADVVIRNPTHFAIALSYNTDKHAAPVVVAKGQDAVALRIVEIANQHQVTVIENKPLARGLYATTELNHEIPEEYYSAVAEILVYVYKLNKKLR
jgi:flagellar biosynthetic protein FlhB